MDFITGIIIGIIGCLSLMLTISMCMVSKRADSRIEEFAENRRIECTGRKFQIISQKQWNKDFKADTKTKVILPKRATKLSAGYDCYAPIDIRLEPGQDAKVPTGIKAYMQPGEVLMAFPRSGLGFKYYCRLANTIGVIDADYVQSDNDGHIFVKLCNEGSEPMLIRQGEAMCQFIFMPFLLVDGDNFESGEIRNGGFGSTK